jgi:hypothetical protein
MDPLRDQGFPRFDPPIPAAERIRELDVARIAGTFAVAGTTGIRNQALYQKYFRDVHTITQHAFLSASRFESARQMMVEVDTDWPFFRL